MGELDLPPTPTTACWLFYRPNMPDGYVQLYKDGRTQVAHRWFYERVIGPIPEGLDLDHLCNVRACCNPWHQDPVTPAENNRRSRLRTPRKLADLAARAERHREGMRAYRARKAKRLAREAQTRAGLLKSPWLPKSMWHLRYPQESA